jgi:hypothetical protein
MGGTSRIQTKIKMYTEFLLKASRDHLDDQDIDEGKIFK